MRLNMLADIKGNDFPHPVSTDVFPSSWVGYTLFGVLRNEYTFFGWDVYEYKSLGYFSNKFSDLLTLSAV